MVAGGGFWVLKQAAKHEALNEGRQRPRQVQLAGGISATELFFLPSEAGRADLAVGQSQWDPILG